MRRNNGEDDYYLFTVSEWKELKTPIAINTDIVKKPRFTNNFLLEHCESAYELFNINSDEEYRLLYELKRMFNKVSVNENGGVIEVDDEHVIAANSGYFEIIGKDGSIIYRCPVAEFKKNPRNAFNQIKRTIR